MGGRHGLLAFVLLGCNPHPGYLDQGVSYRDGSDGSTHSGERGNIIVSEILWSGSVNGDGDWDPTDVFVELRNEGSRPVNISGWILELEGAATTTWTLPEVDFEFVVGQHLFIAAKNTGCFPEPDILLPGLAFPTGDAIRLTLMDRDEHLIEKAGSKTQPPFAGGYDLVRSRSMERVEVMFGARGTQPHIWHYYTPAEVEIANNVHVASDCRSFTGASPGRANSPDYSGAFATGSFE
jgi:hypothetical protein